MIQARLMHFLPQSCPKLFDGLVDDNRRLAEQLSHAATSVGHAEVASGHDWHAWRDLLRPGLMHTLGSPGVEDEG